MAVDYRADILPLVQAGKTDEEIVQIVRTLYRKDCMATGSTNLKTNPDVLHILVAQCRVLRLASDATWQGPLVDYVNSLDLEQPGNLLLKMGFEMLLPQLQIHGRVVFTSSDLEIATLTSALTDIAAALVAQMAAAIPGYAMTPELLYESINKATGGKIWADATLEALQTLRAEYEAEQARLVAIGTVNTKAGRAQAAAQSAREQGQTPEQILAAAQAAWSA